MITFGRAAISEIAAYTSYARTLRPTVITSPSPHTLGSGPSLPPLRRGADSI